jgi:fatty-acid desaturase
MKVELSDKEIREVGESRYNKRYKNKPILGASIIALVLAFLVFKFCEGNNGLIGISLVMIAWFGYLFYVNSLMTKAGKKFLNECKNSQESDVD